jgi:hypothetical protein
MAHLTWLDMDLVPAALLVYLPVLIRVKETEHEGFLSVLCLLTAKYRYTIYRDQYFYLWGYFQFRYFHQQPDDNAALCDEMGSPYCALLCATLLYIQYFVVVRTYISTGTTVPNFEHQFRVAFVV